MKRLTTLFILFVFGAVSTVYGQTGFNEKNVNKTALQYAQLISDGASIEDNAIGRSGITPKQYLYFEALIKNANETELFELTNYPDPKVRCYAYWGLLKKKSKLAFDVLKKNENDTANVYQLSGCKLSNSTVIKFMKAKTEEYKIQKK